MRISRLAPALISLVALAACGSTTPSPSSGTTPSVTTPSASATTPSATPTAKAGPASWRIVASPNFAVKGDNYFNGVACTSASDCWAVGGTNLDDGKTGPQTLAAHWDGTAWKLADAPDSSANGGDMLSAVACVSSSDCWAVGGGGSGYGERTLTERWNGTSWHIVASARLPFGGDLNGVACVSSNDCWAVGDQSLTNAPAGGGLGTLAERWNGSTWSAVAMPYSAGSAPAVAGKIDTLSGVACTSGSDCWAVGSLDTGNGTHALTEHWNGSSWAATSTPNPNGYDNALIGVSCTAANSCWAVGGGGQGSDKTDFYHWNGTKWTVTTDGSNPNTTDPDAITCISADDCWMVGSVEPNPSTSVLLSEHWDGTSWKRTQIPSPPMPNVATTMQGPQPPVLDAITCVAPNDCVAVGSDAVSSSGSHTLVEEYSSQG